MLLATYLHATRPPSPTELGWRFVAALRAHDARAIAQLFPDEELNVIGVSRNQASQIVNEIVLPYGEPFTRDIVQVTLNGNAIAFEKPRGDARYFAVPKVGLVRLTDGEQSFELGTLLSSVWGERRAAFITGRLILDPRPQVRREFQRVKELGMTRSMDWSTHEVKEMPAQPVGY